MMHSHGIGQIMLLTLMMQLNMRFDGPQHKNGLCWAQTYWNSTVALGSLMACSSRFTNLGMMEPQALVQWA
jgi:hypothetical protein